MRFERRGWEFKSLRVRQFRDPSTTLGIRLAGSRFFVFLRGFGGFARRELLFL